MRVKYQLLLMLKHVIYCSMPFCYGEIQGEMLIAGKALITFLLQVVGCCQ